MAQRSARPLWQRLLVSPLLVFYLSAAYFGCVWLVRPEIASAGNLTNVVLAALPLLAMAIGQTLVVITRGIDLSLTAQIALASVLGASIMSQSHGALAGHSWAVPAAVVVVVLTSALIGCLQGAAVACLGMPPFLVTLIALMFCDGLATLYTRSLPISDFPESFLRLGYERWLGVPCSVAIVLALAVAADVGLRHTALGRRLVAIGLNEKTARVSGVPVAANLIAAYTLCGLCTAVATLLYMARLETGKPDLVKDDVLLDCIAAVVIGGTSLSGGRGSVGGAALGVLFVSLIANSLDLFGNLQIWHVLSLKGVVILLAALLDAGRMKFQ